MAKKTKHKHKSKLKLPKQVAGVKIPKMWRTSAQSLVQWFDTPLGRETLAAGLSAMAASLAASGRVRATAAELGEAAGHSAAQGAHAVGGLAGAAATLAAEGVRRLVAGDGGNPQTSKAHQPKGTQPIDGGTAGQGPLAH